MSVSFGTLNALVDLDSCFGTERPVQKSYKLSSGAPQPWNRVSMEYIQIPEGCCYVLITLDRLNHTGAKLLSTSPATRYQHSGTV